MNSEPVKCYFPGDFNPATKLDFKVAQWLSRKIFDVNEVVIVLGKSDKGQLSLEDRYYFWEMYLKTHQEGKIVIYKDPLNSPLTAIYKMHERLPGGDFSIALPERVAKNEDFQSHFEIFPNYQVIITPNYDKKMSEYMLQAVEQGDQREFYKFLPATLTIEEKGQLFNRLKTDKEQEPAVVTEKYWKDMVGSILSNAGLKQ